MELEVKESIIKLHLYERAEAKDGSALAKVLYTVIAAVELADYGSLRPKDEALLSQLEMIADLLMHIYER